MRMKIFVGKIKSHLKSLNFADASKLIFIFIVHITEDKGK